MSDYNRRIHSAFTEFRKAGHPIDRNITLHVSPQTWRDMLTSAEARAPGWAETRFSTPAWGGIPVQFGEYEDGEMILRFEVRA